MRAISVRPANKKEKKQYEDTTLLDAEKLNIPYQVLVRLFILDGLRRINEAA